MRKGLRETSLAFAAWFAATLLTLVLFFVIQAASFWTPVERIENHLRSAFETGALTLYDLRPFDSDLGYHQGRDCLIYGMTILRPAGVGAYVAAPRYGLDSGGRATLCETLRDRLYGEMSADYVERPLPPLLHGYRAVTAIVLSVASVSEMRTAFKAITYLVLFTTIALAIRQLILSLAGRDNVNPTRPVGSIAISVAFFLFYGLSYFGQSPAHAPAAWVLFGFLLFATHYNLYRLSAARFHAAIAIFGAWIAFFENFTGAVLIGLCLLIGLLAIHAHKKIPMAGIVSRSLLAPFAYLGAIGLCFTLTHLLQTWQFGTGVTPGLVDVLLGDASNTLKSQLSANIAPESGATTLLSPIDALVRKIGVLTSGNVQVGVLMALMSLHLLLGALLLVVINCKGRRELLRIGLCLASVLPMLGWILFFPDQTVTEAAYRVRVLVWLPAAAGLALTIAGEVCLARFQFRDHLGMRDLYFPGRG